MGRCNHWGECSNYTNDVEIDDLCSLPLISISVISMVQVIQAEFVLGTVGHWAVHSLCDKLVSLWLDGSMLSASSVIGMLTRRLQCEARRTQSQGDCGSPSPALSWFHLRHSEKTQASGSQGGEQTCSLNVMRMDQM